MKRLNRKKNSVNLLAADRQHVTAIFDVSTSLAASDEGLGFFLMQRGLSLTHCIVSSGSCYLFLTELQMLRRAA